MPCYTDPPSSYEIEAGLVNSLLNEVWGKQFNHSESLQLAHSSKHPEYNKAVPELCRLCKLLEEQGWLTSKSLELQIWWRDHKKVDAKHEAKRLQEQEQERLRQQAILKLTPEELKAIRNNGY